METGAFRKGFVDAFVLVRNLEQAQEEENAGVCFAFPVRDCVTKKQRKRSRTCFLIYYSLPVECCTFIRPCTLHRCLIPQRGTAPVPVAALAPCWPACRGHSYITDTPHALHRHHTPRRKVPIHVLVLQNFGFHHCQCSF